MQDIVSKHRETVLLGINKNTNKENKNIGDTEKQLSNLRTELKSITYERNALDVLTRSLISDTKKSYKNMFSEDRHEAASRSRLLQSVGTKSSQQSAAGKPLMNSSTTPKVNVNQNRSLISSRLGSSTTKVKPSRAGNLMVPCVRTGSLPPELKSLHTNPGDGTVDSVYFPFKKTVGKKKSIKKTIKPSCSTSKINAPISAPAPAAATSQFETALPSHYRHHHTHNRHHSGHHRGHNGKQRCCGDVESSDSQPVVQDRNSSEQPAHQGITVDAVKDLVVTISKESHKQTNCMLKTFENIVHNVTKESHRIRGEPSKTTSSSCKQLAKTVLAINEPKKVSRENLDLESAIYSLGYKLITPRCSDSNSGVYPMQVEAVPSVARHSTPIRGHRHAKSKNPFRGMRTHSSVRSNDNDESTGMEASPTLVSVEIDSDLDPVRSQSSCGHARRAPTGNSHGVKNIEILEPGVFDVLLASDVVDDDNEDRLPEALLEKSLQPAASTGVVDYSTVGAAIYDANLFTFKGIHVTKCNPEDVAAGATWLSSHAQLQLNQRARDADLSEKAEEVNRLYPELTSESCGIIPPCDVVDANRDCIVAKDTSWIMAGVGGSACDANVLPPMEECVPEAQIDISPPAPVPETETVVPVLAHNDGLLVDLMTEIVRSNKDIVMTNQSLFMQLVESQQTKLSQVSKSVPPGPTEVEWESQLVVGAVLDDLISSAIIESMSNMSRPGPVPVSIQPEPGPTAAEIAMELASVLRDMTMRKETPPLTLPVEVKTVIRTPERESVSSCESSCCSGDSLVDVPSSFPKRLSSPKLLDGIDNPAEGSDTDRYGCSGPGGADDSYVGVVDKYSTPEEWDEESPGWLLRVRGGVNRPLSGVLCKEFRVDTGSNSELNKDILNDMEVSVKCHNHLNALHLTRACTRNSYDDSTLMSVSRASYVGSERESALWYDSGSSVQSEWERDDSNTSIVLREESGVVKGILVGETNSLAMAQSHGGALEERNSVSSTGYSSESVNSSFGDISVASDLTDESSVFGERNIGQRLSNSKIWSSVKNRSTLGNPNGSTKLNTGHRHLKAKTPPLLVSSHMRSGASIATTRLHQESTIEEFR